MRQRIRQRTAKLDADEGRAGGDEGDGDGVAAHVETAANAAWMRGVGECCGASARMSESEMNALHRRKVGAR